MRSKGDVSRVFLATVSHGIGFLFLFSFAACLAVSCSNAFQRWRFESFFWLRFRMASAFCFYLVLQRVLLFEAFGLVFCCSRLSGAVFQGQISRGPKDVFVGSKGNVKDFLARVLAVFGSCLDGVWDFSHLGLQGQSVFCCSRLSGLCFAVRGWFCDSFAACFAVRGFRACVLLFEAFGSGGPRPDFARPKRCFCGVQR